MNHSVSAFFEGEARHYSDYFAEKKSGRCVIFRKRLSLACQLAKGANGAILDCAIGTGDITEAVMSAGSYQSATLIDISGDMLRQAQVKLRGVADSTRLEFIRSDIFEFLERDTKTLFDLILCLGLIAHTGKLDILLANLCKRLTPRGRILLQTSLDSHAGNRIWRTLMHRRATARHGYELSYFTHKQIAVAAHQAGLSILGVNRYAIGVPFMERLSPKANYYIETICDGLATRCGAEAIYSLGRAE